MYVLAALHLLLIVLRQVIDMVEPVVDEMRRLEEGFAARDNKGDEVGHAGMALRLLLA